MIEGCGLLNSKTRLDGDLKVSIEHRLPFDDWHFINTIGLTGGIWLLWRTDEVNVQILNSTK